MSWKSYKDEMCIECTNVTDLDFHLLNIFRDIVSGAQKITAHRHYEGRYLLDDSIKVWIDHNLDSVSLIMNIESIEDYDRCRSEYKQFILEDLDEFEKVLNRVRD